MNLSVRISFNSIDCIENLAKGIPTKSDVDKEGYEVDDPQYTQTH